MGGGNAQKTAMAVRAPSPPNVLRLRSVNAYDCHAESQEAGGACQSERPRLDDMPCPCHYMPGSSKVYIRTQEAN
jgi:hypothetical protein